MWRSVLKGKSLGAVWSLKLLLLGIFSNSNSAVLYFLVKSWVLRVSQMQIFTMLKLWKYIWKNVLNEQQSVIHEFYYQFFIYFLNRWVYYGCFIIIKHRKNTIAIIDSCMYYMHCVAKSSLFRSADLHVHVHVHVYHNIFWFKLGDRKSVV